MKIFKTTLLLLLIASTAHGAGWFDRSWSKRTAISVEGNAEAVDDYMAQMDVYYHNAPIEDDGIFEWFMSTAIRYAGSHDRTYFGYYCSDSTVKIRQWDEDTQTMSDAVTLWSSWGQGDDHCAPSIIALQHQTGANAVHNGKLLVGVAEHGIKMQVRRSTNPEDITAFDSAIQLESNEASYAMLAETSDGTVWLFYRYSATGTYNDSNIYYRTSTDAGATWSGRTEMYDMYDVDYTMVYPDGADIHFILNSVDRSLEPTYQGTAAIAYSAYVDIFYAKYDGADGRFEKADGTPITLPITTASQVDTVRLTPRTTTDGKQDTATWLWDIKASSGTPYLISVEGPTNVDPATTEYTVRRHHWTGSAWAEETVCNTGIFGTYAYPAGAVVDDSDPDIIYAAVNDANSSTQMQQWVRGAGGTWSKQIDITTNAPGDCFRPIAVRNGAGHFKVLYSYTERYTHFLSGDWDSTLFAWPGYNTVYGGQCDGQCRTDFGDLRFSEVDGTTLVGNNGMPYIKSKTDGWKATVATQVDVPADGAADSSIYLYYGNATATNANTEDNRLAMAVYKEEFSGSTLPTGWSTVAGTPTVANGVLTLSGAESTQVYWDQLATPIGYEYRVKLKMVSDGNAYFLFLSEGADTSNNSIQYFYQTGQGTFIPRENGNDPVNDIHFTLTEDLYSFNEFFVRRKSNILLEYGINQDAPATFGNGTMIPDGNLNVRLADITSGSIEVDWVYITPTVTVEPTIHFLNAASAWKPHLIMTQ